jgi:hypothetical protein
VQVVRQVPNIVEMSNRMRKPVPGSNVLAEFFPSRGFVRVSIPRRDEHAVPSEECESDRGGGTLAAGSWTGGCLEGGISGGVVGGGVGGLPEPPPPPAPAFRAPVRIGGQITPPQLVKRVE